MNFLLSRDRRNFRFNRRISLIKDSHKSLSELIEMRWLKYKIYFCVVPFEKVDTFKMTLRLSN